MITGNSFEIVVVGTNKDSFINEAVQKYSKNIHKFAIINWHIVKESQAKDIKKRIHEEELQVTKKINQLKPQLVVAMQAGNLHADSNALAKEISAWINNYKKTAIIIGGPFGLSEDFVDKADKRLSLSTLTFNHLIIRPMLAEQLYRSLSIIYNTGYHH